MEKLKKIGFIPVGSCKLDPVLNSGVRFVIEVHSRRRVVYAFVVGTTTKYIGVCDNTATNLQARMGRYQGMIGAGTNKRITTQIKNMLTQGHDVSIWALLPEDDLRWNNLSVDLIKGLENPLIKEIRPEWNIQG